MNLRKIKCSIFGTYCSPNQPVEYFFKHVGYALDAYGQTYEKCLLASDFNTEETEPFLSEFSTNCGSKSLVKEKTCFKNPENSRCIGLFITNSIFKKQKKKFLKNNSGSQWLI